MKKLSLFIIGILMLLSLASCKTDIGYSELTYITKDGEEKTLSVAPSTNKEFITEVVYAINSNKPKSYDYYAMANSHCNVKATFYGLDGSQTPIDYSYTQADKLTCNANEDVLFGYCYYSYNVTKQETKELLANASKSSIFYQYPDITYLSNSEGKIKVSNSFDILKNNLFYDCVAYKLFNNLTPELIESNDLYIADTTKSKIKFNYKYINEDNENVYCIITVDSKTCLVTEILVLDDYFSIRKIIETYTYGIGRISEPTYHYSNIQISFIYDNVPKINFTDDQKSEYK